MSSKKIITIATILTVAIIFLFIYPAANRTVNAEQTLYSGNEDHSITLQEGAAITKAYRLSASSNDALAHYFGGNAIKKVLEQSGCVGIRLYYGKHADGSSALVIVGVDHNGNDIALLSCCPIRVETGQYIC
jgi:hypothetical protein